MIKINGVEAGKSGAVNVAGQGIILIMGCGHPTVERIVARAEALFEQPVVGIVGGFHYDGQNKKEVQSHNEFLLDKGAECLYNKTYFIH